MKRVLWGCVFANIVYSLFQSTVIFTPAYIIVLLLLIILCNKGNNELLNTLALTTAITGIIISIIVEINIMIIITGIVIILQIINQKFMQDNQERYDESIGIKLNKEKKEKKAIKVVTKYDIDRIKDAFNNFVEGYDKTNQMINLKHKHTLNVADNALNIARSIGLDEEGRYLAYVIGILHDIGRFDQIKEYNTFEDTNMMDHTNHGQELLEEGLIRQFVHDKKYDNIILKAVKNHNKSEIDSNFTDDEKLYCSIIRDADKLDIFKSLGEGTYDEDYKVTKNMVISSNVINEINKKHMLNYNFSNNELDNVIVKLSMIYDINYEYTLREVKKKDYLTKYILLLDTLDTIKIELKKIVDTIYRDIDSKLK